jgi:hypothetical protein
MIFSLSCFVTPDPSLNYGFISQIFALLSVVSAVFFVAQYQFGATSVTGFWIVPAPCLPALFYTMYLHSLSGKGAAHRQLRGDKKTM